MEVTAEMQGSFIFHGLPLYVHGRFHLEAYTRTECLGGDCWEMLSNRIWRSMHVVVHVLRESLLIEVQRDGDIPELLVSRSR